MTIIVILACIILAVTLTGLGLWLHEDWRNQQRLERSPLVRRTDQNHEAGR